MKYKIAILFILAMCFYQNGKATEFFCPSEEIASIDEILEVPKGWSVVGTREVTMSLHTIAIGIAGEKATLKPDDSMVIDDQTTDVWWLNAKGIHYTMVCGYFNNTYLSKPLPPSVRRCEITYPTDRFRTRDMKKPLICE